MSLRLLDDSAPGEERVAGLPAESVGWPTLESLRLGPEALERRRRGIGGSDASVILSGNAERIRGLWLEKRGEAEGEDLSSNLAAMLGCWTEAFNRQWFTSVSGLQVSGVGTELVCPRHPWRRCTLDGLAGENVWEAKHTNAFANSEEVLARYMPQLQHNMAVAGKARAFLSILYGNHKYELIEVASDWLYELELLEAESRFWECVTQGVEPVALPAPEPPKPVGVREVCLQGNNAWASAAFDWLDNRDAAKLHAEAAKTIKALVEADVARAFAHGIEAKRSRSGAITIRELGQ